SNVRSVTVTAPFTLFAHSWGATLCPLNAVAFATRPPTGLVIVAWFELPLVMPSSVTGCVITTCSGYVPGQTCTVAGAAVSPIPAALVCDVGQVGLQMATT